MDATRSDIFVEKYSVIHTDSNNGVQDVADDDDDVPLKMDETKSDIFVEQYSVIHTDSNNSVQDVADDEDDGMFLKLGYCDLSPNVYTEFDQNSIDSWDIYTQCVKFYDLIQFSGLKEQFNSNIMDVQLLSLCSNDLKALSEALIQNQHVTIFNLTGNELDVTGCFYLSKLLRENNVIKHLELSCCNIDSIAANELAKSLTISELQSLNLSYNKLECSGFQSILEALQTNISLQELDLSSNNIRRECIDDISMFIEINSKLKKLNLSENSLNNEADLALLMRTLGVHNETIQVLILQWNGISGESSAEVFRNLMIKTEVLKILDLSWNNFRNVGKILSQGIQNATTLEHLDISNNPLTTDDIIDLLNGVVESTSLMSLGITHVIVNEQLKKAISNAQLRVPNFNVLVGLYKNTKSDIVDYQALYLQRLHFLGVDKPKKKKTDIGHTLLRMKNEGNLEPMTKTKFISTFKQLNIKDSEEIIEELAKEFRNTNKKIDVTLMLNKYLEIYPNTAI